MKHWRRYEETVQAIRSEGSLYTVVATACGRIVPNVDATGNPSETDCPECERVRLGLVEVDAREMAAKYNAGPGV